MRFSVVNLNSDSSDTEDVNGNAVNNSKCARKKSSTLQSAQKFSCENEQSDVQKRVPLFKIIFRDEGTSRIYRKRLEDITKYLVSAKLGEDSESNSGDLVLEVYEPTGDFNTTTTFDTTVELSATPVIIDNNQNYNFVFNFEKEMIKDSMTNGKLMSNYDSHSQNNYTLPINSCNQTTQPLNMFHAFNREIQNCLQPQQEQQFILQSECSSPGNLNVRKRKWVDDSDSTSIKKKIRVESTSECLPHLQNRSDMLENAGTNIPLTAHYDPMWWNPANVQSTNTETIENHETNVPKTACYDPVWYISNVKENTTIESVPVEKTKGSCFQVQAPSSSVSNEKSNATFTYRVLKVGTFDYTMKRTFSISKDGIQLCAHHLGETSTIVKVNIEIANTVKIEASFSQIMPALFLYINDKAAMIIKEALGINNDSKAYLDPCSTDENCNKIIILPDNMPENSRVLTNLLKVGLIHKLDKESSDTILLNSFSKTLERPWSQDRLSADELFLYITSHSVRIGTYKCSKMRFNVMISTQGIQFQVPKIADDEIYKKITIDFLEIDKLYFSMKKVFALFLHVNSHCAERIRSLIEMSKKNTKKVYFDPDSDNIAEQRLVILFNKIKPQQQETLRHLLSYTQSGEISLDKIIHQMLFNHM